MNTELKINKIHVLASIIREKGNAYSDLTVVRVENKLFKQTVYFGIKTEFSEVYFADLRARSSVHKRWMFLSNGCGTIDSSFRGEWRAVFYKIPFISTKYKVKEHACQFGLQKVLKYTKKYVSELTPSKRGEDGFGSTGK